MAAARRAHEPIDESKVLVEVQDSGTGTLRRRSSRSRSFATSAEVGMGLSICRPSSTPRRHDIGCEQSRPRRDVLDHVACRTGVILPVRHWRARLLRILRSSG
jgi:hypothetical protein